MACDGTSSERHFAHSNLQIVSYDVLTNQAEYSYHMQCISPS